MAKCCRAELNLISLDSVESALGRSRVKLVMAAIGRNRRLFVLQSATARKTAAKGLAALPSARTPPSRAWQRHSIRLLE